MATDETKGRMRQRVSTILDVDETIRDLSETVARMNRTLDDFDVALASFTGALESFTPAVEGFNGVVGHMDRDLMPRVDAIVAKAEALLGLVTLPGATVVEGVKKGVAGVAGAAGSVVKRSGGKTAP